MKTLQECKNEVAKKNGFKDWEDVVLQFQSKNYVDEVAELHASQQLSALQQENETLKATFEEFKRGIAKGSELYAHLKFDDQEFTPYQLALQENEKLKEELKYCHKRMAEAYNELNKATPSNQR